jgi:hypothetical protein
MNKITRFGLMISAVSAIILAGPLSASAATMPTLPSVPSVPAPVVGGLIDSLVGIATGTAYGAGSATLAVLNSLTGGAV